MKWSLLPALLAGLGLDAGLLSRAVADTATVTVNATQVRNTVSGRAFGLNTGVWQSYRDTPQTIDALRKLNPKIARFPGGGSEVYYWPSNTTYYDSRVWGVSFDNFVHVATNLGVQSRITVNYGSGTPELAAAWVRHANITNNLGFKYWEIGNECYLPNAVDWNVPDHDGFTYATRFTNYFRQMKAVDPSIKIGAVIDVGEELWANGHTSHPATNSRTHQVHYGWTPVVLATLKNLGVTPDYLIYHNYTTQQLGQEDDAALLRFPPSWTDYAAQLRQMINDYFGPAPGIEIDVTEHNSIYGNPGKQTTSLVNALFLADSYGEVLKTEVKAIDWFSSGISSGTGNNNSSSLYGWRNYGSYDLYYDFDAKDAYPTYYAYKLLKYFARGGDQVVTASSSSADLAAHAVKRTNGSLALLVINKKPSETFNTTFNINGYQPATNALVYSFGIPQDLAAQNYGTGPARDIALTNFNGAGVSFSYSFAPYSMTVLTLPPVAGPPPEPTDLDAVSGETQVALSWLRAAGAASYRVKRATTSGGPYTVIGTNTTTSYTNTGVANGTAYYYVVSAVHAYGESGNSIEASATPAISLYNRATGGTPSANDPGAAYAFDGLVELMFYSGWDTRYVQYDFGSGVTWAVVRYDVTSSPSDYTTDPMAWQFQGSANGSTWITLDTRSGEMFSARVQTKSYTITNNTEYRYYRFNVTANRVSGKGLRIAELALMAYNKNRVPSVPTGLAASAVSSNQINLAWSDNANNETGFRIERKTGAGGSYAQVANVSSNATGYTNTGLASGTTYYYRVYATNSVGSSAASEEIYATTSGGTSPPTVPTELGATAGDGQVSLSWNPSSGAASYRVKRSTTSGSGYGNITTNTTTSYTDTGLANETTYYYVVSAANAYGESANSSEASATPQFAAPLAPSRLMASAVSSNQINLAWTDNANNETGFRIERKTGAAGTYAQVAAVGSKVTAYSNTGLTAGTTYYYRVFATNSVGSSAASNEASATTPGGGVPVRNSLALWLAGDAGVTTNGSAVAAWGDQSGQGRDASQSNVSSQPTLVTTSTGKPGIHLNGTGQYLDFMLPVGGLTGMSIVVVSANYPQQNGTASGWNDPPENSTMIAWPEDTTYGNWDGVYLNSFQTNVYWRFGTTQVPNGYKYNLPVSLGAAASLTTLVKNGTAETLYLNGAQAMQVTTSDSVLDGVGTDATAHLAKATWTATYFAGDIMEVLVYTNAMSTSDRISVENYLRNKYLPGLLPAVAITSPTNNARFAVSDNIPITATASGGNGTIARVEFFAGSTLIGTKTSAPYSVTWSNATAGTYNLTAKATDTVGAWAVGGAVAVVVAPLSVAIAASGDTVVISWAASAMGFVLETSPRLAAPSWAAVDQTPVVVGDQNRVTRAIGPSTTFFRLSK